MYKVAKEFSDLLNGLKAYKVGDTYEEVNASWTANLVERKLIERVSFEKKRYEAVQKEQD